MHTYDLSVSTDWLIESEVVDPSELAAPGGKA
jgi:hypothetical protein